MQMLFGTFLRFFFVATIGLLALGCNSESRLCEDDEECGGSRICATTVACTGETCSGLCARTCMQDAECDENEICVDDRQNRGYCRRSVAD